MCILSESKVGVVDVDSFNLTHNKFWNIGCKLNQQLQLQTDNVHICMYIYINEKWKFLQFKETSVVHILSTCRNDGTPPYICPLFGVTNVVHANPMGHLATYTYCTHFLLYHPSTFLSSCSCMYH